MEAKGVTIHLLRGDLAEISRMMGPIRRDANRAQARMDQRRFIACVAAVLGKDTAAQVRGAKQVKFDVIDDHVEFDGHIVHEQN